MTQKMTHGKEMKSDPLVGGGLVEVPGNVTNAHVLMPDHTWRLRWELQDDDAPRDVDGHGSAILGTGQIIPREGVRIAKPADWPE